MPPVSDCMEFGDYLEAGVHEAIRENTFATDWARAKVRITKSLKQLGDNRSKWRALLALWALGDLRKILWNASLGTL